MAEDAFADGSYLLRAFAQTKNDLGEAVAQRPMVIHPGEAEILERQRLERIGRSVRRYLAGTNRLEKGEEPLCVYG